MPREYTDRKPGHTAVRCDIPDDDHDALRALAGRSGMSMAQYVREIVLDAVRKQVVLPKPPKHQAKEEKAPPSEPKRKPGRPRKNPPPEGKP